MDIQEKLTLMEDIFQKYMDHKYDEAKFCKELSVVLSSIHKYQYSVMISNQNRKEKFFGMRCFPMIKPNGPSLGSSVYDNELLLLLNQSSSDKVKVSFSECYNRWKENDQWMIEIDSSALDHTQVKLYPKELVAMLLHELGHVIYSDKTLERIYKAFMDMRATQNTAAKYSMRVFSFMFYPAIAAACMYRRWVVGKNETNIELFADKNVVNYGYGEFLQSAFEKVVKAFGRTDVDTFNVDSEVQWATDIVTTLTARHNRVGQEIYVKAARSGSKYLQSLYRTIITKLGMCNRNRYTGVISNDIPALESLFADDYIINNELIFTIDGRVALEAMTKSAAIQSQIALESKLALKNRNQYEQDIEELNYALDTIRIDIDEARTSYEKKNIIDRLYAVREELNLWDERFAQYPYLSQRYGEKINRLKTKVNSFVDETLMKKTYEKQYGVFVKYPVGYEG